MSELWQPGQSCCKLESPTVSDYISNDLQPESTGSEPEVVTLLDVPFASSTKVIANTHTLHTKEESISY